MPIAIPVTAAGMSEFLVLYTLGSGPNNPLDYASVVFAGFTIISGAWYFIRGRKAFTGPPVESDVEPHAVAACTGEEVEKI